MDLFVSSMRGEPKNQSFFAPLFRCTIMAIVATLICAILTPTEFSDAQSGDLSATPQVLKHAVLTSGSSWAVQGISANITDISCVGANACMAVGSAGDGSSALVMTTSNGVTWASTTVADATFTYVACTSVSDCWAGSGSTIWRTTNGGTSWSSASLPTDSGGSQDYLSGNFSCPTTSVCFAPAQDTNGPTVDEWSSGSWSETGALGCGSGYCAYSINDVSCSSSSACVGTGYHYVGNGLAAILYSTTNGGASWNQLGTGDNAVNPDQEIDGVSCLSNGYCEWTGYEFLCLGGDTCSRLYEGGYSTNGGATFTNDFSSGGQFAGAGTDISCWATDACLSVGDFEPGSTPYLAAEGGGSPSWSFELSNPPALQQFSAPDGVSCPASGTCYTSTEQGILRTTDGGAHWAAVVNFVSSPSSASNAESCPGTLTCFMVGSTGQVYQTSSGGGIWLAGKLPGLGVNPGSEIGSDPSTLEVVSCSSTSTCVAAGGATGEESDPNDGPAQVFETTDSGESWTNLSSAVPTIGVVSAIACPSTNECVLGRLWESTSGTTTKLDVGNPQTNSWQTPVSLGNYGSVTGFACSSATECFGVTSDGDVLAGSGTGLSSWSVTTPASGLTSLKGVACSSNSDCVAVGSGSGDGVIYETTNGGSSWSLDSTTTSSGLLGVSCPTTTNCVLVGLAGSVYQGSPGSWTNVTPSGEPGSLAALPTVACDSSGNCIAPAEGTVDSIFLSNDGVSGSGPDDGAIQPSELYGDQNGAEPCFACYLESKGEAPQDFVGDPVDTATGDYTETLPLVSIPARGLPFGVTLTYDAQLAQAQVAGGATSPGPFGWGWSSNTNMSITLGPGTNQDTVNQEGGSQVVYNAPSGGIGTFTAIDSDRVTATLTSNGSTYTFTRDGGLQIYTFNSSGQLTSESDANGNTTTFGTEASGTGTCPTTGAANCSTITDPGGRTITLVNATSGLVSKVIDPAGNTWNLNYTSGNLASVVAPAVTGGSPTWTYTYDTANSNSTLVHDMTTVTPPNNVGHSQIAYDSSGRVYCQVAPAEQGAGVTCPASGGSWSYGMTMYAYAGTNLSATGGSTTITDPHGSVTQDDYSYGVLTAQTTGVGTAEPATWLYVRDPATLMPIEVVDPDGNVTLNTFDGQGNLLSTTDTLGNTTTYQYGDGSFPDVPTKEFEPPAGSDTQDVETDYTYDSYGNLTSTTVDGPTSAQNLVTTDTVCESASCTGGYKRGDVESTTDPDGVTTTSKYDSYGDVDSTSVPNPASGTNTTTYAYNSLGQLYCAVSPNETADSVACPAFGQPRVAHTQTFAYDADGRQTSSEDADANTTSYVYDADGNQTLVTDPLGNETKTVYDADDRPTTVTDGYGTTSAASTTYGYDIQPGTTGSTCSTVVAGATYCQTTQQTVGSTTMTTTDYFNALGNLIETTDPDATSISATTYTFDPAGNAASMTNGAGETLYGYDSDNRLTNVSYPSTASGYVTPPAESYSYDAEGNRTSMSDGSGTTSYSYDTFGRLISVTDGNAHTVTYGYDKSGNMTCLSYPNSGTTTCQNATSGTGLVSYGYVDDVLTTMTDWTGKVTSFGYDNDSNLTTTTLPTAPKTTKVTNTYDPTDALTDTTYKVKGGTAVDLASLTRNADELISKYNPNGSGDTTTYAYNPLNEVTTGIGSTYSYDTASRLTTAMPAGGTKTYDGYNPDSELCWIATTAATNPTGPCANTTPPSGAKAFTYDATGDRLSSTPSGGSATDYDWDQAGNLNCETVPTGSTGYSCTSGQQNIYNADGLRMSDTPTGGSTQEFTWNPNASVPQLLEDGTSYYLYGPNVGDAPIEQISISAGTVSFPISDTTGVRRQLSATASNLGTNDYNSYGVCTSCSLTSPFGFEGGYTDASGLIYLIHRYYDPATEQYLSVDPLVDETGTPYTFTDGDAVNGSDPNGLGFLGGLADSFDPFSQNNVFYRFGSHHPVAGRVVAIGSGGVAAVIACTAFCAATVAALGLGGSEEGEANPGFFSRAWQQCQAFDETGSIGGGDLSPAEEAAADARLAAEEEAQYAFQHVGEEAGRPSYDEILQTRSNAQGYNLGGGRTGYWSNSVQVVINNIDLPRSTAFYRSTPLPSG
jgi:RHS repeat-associated protein